MKKYFSCRGTRDNPTCTIGEVHWERKLATHPEFKIPRKRKPQDARNYNRKPSIFQNELTPTDLTGMAELMIILFVACMGDPI